MSKAGDNESVRRQSSAPEASDASFDRDLAELNAGLARLERLLAPRASPTVPPPQPRVRREKPAPAPTRPPAVPVAAEPAVQPPKPPPVAVERPEAPPPPPPPPPPHPTGTDLADPKNFGVMPPTPDLDRGTASPDEYRKRLARHIAFANKVLHTSRVPAAVWREWRAFEKAAQQHVRALTSGAVGTVDPN